MSDPTDNRGKGENVRNLTDALRRVRTAEAERSDVVVELRDAERARLEMLADELKSVFAEVPADDEQFVFAVAPGIPPRLWIDLTSFVVMARDHRTYRFLKDTRLGRTVILESDNMGAVADTVTHYIAERIIERDRAIEGDWVVKRIADEAAGRRQEARRAVAALVEPAPVRTAMGLDRRHLGWVVAAFMSGLVVGLVVLLAYTLLRAPAG